MTRSTRHSIGSTNRLLNIGRLSVFLMNSTALLLFSISASAENGSIFADKVEEPTIELSLDFESIEITALEEGDSFNSDKATETTLELDYTHPFVFSDQLSGQAALSANTQRIDTGVTSSDNSVELQQLWLHWQADKKSAWVGRREIADSTSWWWDDTLSGIGLGYRNKQFSSQIMAAISTEPWSSLDSVNDPESDSIFMLLGSLSTTITDTTDITYFISHQTDVSSDYQLEQTLAESNFDETDDDLTWLGFRFERDLTNVAPGIMSLLLDAAWMTGKTTEYELKEDADDETLPGSVSEKTTRSITGWALNGWLHWQPPALSGIEFRLGYAYGSGTAENHADGTRTFRQTGLHSNEASTFYYGNITEPSLSNLQVASVIISYPFGSESRLSGQFNHYRRASVADETLDWDSELELQTSSRDLGHEAALGYDYQFENDLSVELRVARFQPGEAFGDGHIKPINQYSVSINYEF